ncbi:hypothetical protein RUM43_008176 [Polyplax serrata]|uniref:Uncharacterized protein n=1 Tax=Polyplax serrata TaxID=468196 RepID=A0AAN8SAB5_POLSC
MFMICVPMATKEQDDGTKKRNRNGYDSNEETAGASTLPFFKYHKVKIVELYVTPWNLKAK